VFLNGVYAAVGSVSTWNASACLLGVVFPLSKYAGSLEKLICLAHCSRCSRTSPWSNLILVDRFLCFLSGTLCSSVVKYFPGLDFWPSGHMCWLGGPMKSE
jgi:hypothetical protein